MTLHPSLRRLQAALEEELGKAAESHREALLNSFPHIWEKLALVDINLALHIQFDPTNNLSERLVSWWKQADHVPSVKLYHALRSSNSAINWIHDNHDWKPPALAEDGSSNTNNDAPSHYVHFSPLYCAAQRTSPRSTDDASIIRFNVVVYEIYRLFKRAKVRISERRKRRGYTGGRIQGEDWITDLTRHGFNVDSKQLLPFLRAGSKFDEMVEAAGGHREVLLFAGSKGNVLQLTSEDIGLLVSFIQHHARPQQYSAIVKAILGKSDPSMAELTDSSMYTGYEVSTGKHRMKKRSYGTESEQAASSAAELQETPSVLRSNADDVLSRLNDARSVDPSYVENVFPPLDVTHHGIDESIYPRKKLGDDILYFSFRQLDIDQGSSSSIYDSWDDTDRLVYT